MVHSALKQAVEECIRKAISHLTAAFIRFHSCFWQKIRHSIRYWRTQRTDSAGPPNVGLKLGAVSLGFSLSLPFFILFLHFVSCFQTRKIPPGDYMSITCWNVERSLMFSLEGFFFLDTFQWDHARGRMRASRLESAQATSLIISIRAYSSSLALHMEVPFHLLKA